MMGFLGLQLWILGPQGTTSVFDPTIAAITSTKISPELGWILAIGVAVVLIGLAVLHSVRVGFNWRAFVLPVFLSAMALVADVGLQPAPWHAIGIPDSCW